MTRRPIAPLLKRVSPRHAAEPAHVGRRAALAAALSAFVPGVGHLAVGRRKLGLILVGMSLLTVAVVWGWAARQSTTGLIAWLIRPTVLTWLLIVNMAILLARTAVAVHAYRAALGRLHLGTKGPLAVAVLVVAALVVVPHGAAAYVTLRSQAVLNAVFLPSTSSTFERDAPPVDDLMSGDAAGGDADGVVDHDETDEGDSGEASGPANGADGPNGTTGENDEGGAGSVVSDAASANPWIVSGRLTLALLGSDAGPGRHSARTDALMVVSVDTSTGTAAVFSIDRYLRDFPVPDRIAADYEEICAAGGAWDYLNALYTCATGRGAAAFAALYPDAADPGSQALTDTLALLLDLPIAHYAKADMEGFVRLVDALGGVEIDLVDPITVRMSPAHDDTDWRVFEMHQGRQTMDGETALAFARMRDPGDGPRMRRQRCLVTSVVENTGVTEVLRRFGDLSTAIESHVVTNIPLAALPDLIEVVARVDHRALVGVGFGPPTYRGEHHVPQVSLIRQRVDDILNDPSAAQEQARTVEGSEEVCR